MARENQPRFFNRELSWLEFNGRVLEEALEPAAPPLERLKFLAIVSSNLDEFYAVRVAALKRQEALAPAALDPAGMTAAEQLDTVRARVRAMTAAQYKCLRESLLPTLEKAGIRLKRILDLTRDQIAYLDTHFDREILPTLTPMAADGGRPFPTLGDGELCLAVGLRSAEGEPRVALVPLPKVLPRLLRMPSHSGVELLFIEDAVRRFLPRLFQGFVVQKSLVFRAIRDADLNVEEEKDEDFAEMMTEVLRQRRRSLVVRLEVEEDAPPPLLAFLRKSLDAAAEDIYAAPGPLNLKSFFELAGMPGLDALRDPPWTPQPLPELPAGESLWQTLRGRDILLHHPYDAFDPVVRFVSEAAGDPNVLAIKQTLYRCGGGSKIVRALERAAENGKHVCVLVELKARFDETRNIEWAKRLERAGAHVIYGLAGLKTHAKACLVVRREPDGIRRYVHLATGNYNESTARLYTDLGFMTGDDAFGADISAFFNTITGCSVPSQWQKIEMAPLGLKGRVLRMIQREASRSSASQPGLIMAKMNSLVDPDVIKALYDAAKAGVKIRLNIRGVCCLKPGGRRQDIEVTSIVGRFLEHSRVFYFHNGGEEELYLSSADWMPRNLDRRVELMFPIEAPALKARILRILEMCFQDNVKARRLLSSGRYERAHPAAGAAALNVQQALMDEALERSASAERAARGEFKPRTPQKP